MAEPLSAIRNIGPALEAAFQRAGIKDAETLRDLGTDAGHLERFAFNEIHIQRP